MIPRTLQEFLTRARIDDSVFALRPDYRAMLLAVDGLIPGPGDQASDAPARTLSALTAQA